jgi:hypothetical protein
VEGITRAPPLSTHTRDKTSVLALEKNGEYNFFFIEQMVIIFHPENLCRIFSAVGVYLTPLDLVSFRFVNLRFCSDVTE